MQLHRFEDPKAFYDRIESFLMTHEAENILPLSLVRALAKDISRYGDDPPYMALVEEDGQTVFMALRTPPHNLVLPMCDVLDALTLVAQDAYEKYGDELRGVNAPSDVSKAFADHWQALTGQAYRKGYSLRIFRLDVVNPVTGVSGKFRRIAEEDRSVIVEWIKRFNQEAEGKETDTAQAERAFDRKMNSTDVTGIYVWEDGGEVVSIAAGTRPTLNGFGVGLVYTPPEKRRRGYASACVAALSQHLLDSGRKFCFLYTDLANPTSNHIYQEIGYRPVCDADEYLFS